MTHTILSIEAEAASGPGALDGFRYRCSCGDTAAYSVRSMTEDFARSHTRHMNEKERRASAQAQARAVRVVAQRKAAGR